MKTLVIGGAGFLGSHIVEALLEDKHKVTVMSRSPDSAAERLPAAVKIVQGDINTLDHKALKQLLASFDGLVYAAGADERTIPDIDAKQFYYRENVELCRKVLTAAQDTNISHVVLLNSVFTHFNRVRPDLKLAENHTYIDSRVKQSEMALATAKNHFIITVLEIPWVFGSSEHRESQWAALVRYARVASPLVSLGGGTVAISARNVGKATVGALTRPTTSASLPIGDCNMSWDEMLRKFRKLSGRKQAKIVQLPDTAFAGMMRMGGLAQSLFKAKAGLDFAKLHEVLTEENYIDPAESQQLLGYGGDSIDTAFAETVSSVPELSMRDGWNKLKEAIKPGAAG